VDFNSALKEPFESLIADIKTIEDEACTVNAVIVESVKP
jgi:hypothetical protein